MLRILVVLICTSVGGFAQAQSVKDHFIKSDKRQYENGLTATPMVGTYGSTGVEIGGKFSFEPFPQGFVTPINDSVSFEAGLFRGVTKYHTRTLATVSMRWDFNLVPLWTVFGAPGISLRSVETRHDATEPEPLAPFIALCGGGLLNFSPKHALRLEYDLVETAMRVGLMFRF